jgi:hypothetical protein
MVKGTMGTRFFTNKKPLPITEYYRVGGVILLLLLCIPQQKIKVMM